MNKAKLLEQLRNDVFTRLAPSKIHGVGVFAIKPIPEGTDPFRGDRDRTGRPIRIAKEELSDVPETVRKLVHDMCMVEEGYYLMPNNGIEEVTKMWYVNHSPAPNLVVIGEDFITDRDIAEGEELTVDYTTYSEEVDL